MATRAATPANTHGAAPRTSGPRKLTAEERAIINSHHGPADDSDVDLDDAPRAEPVRGRHESRASFKPPGGWWPYLGALVAAAALAVGLPSITKENLTVPELLREPFARDDATDRADVADDVANVNSAENPGAATDQQPRTEQAGTEDALVAAGGNASGQIEAEGTQLAVYVAPWTHSAETLLGELTRLTEPNSFDGATMKRLASLLDSLSKDTRQVLPRLLGFKPGAEESPLSLIPDDQRQTLVRLDLDLRSEQQRLTAIEARELKRSRFTTKLQNGLLPRWFIDGRTPTADELTRLAADLEKTANASSTPNAAATRTRDFHTEALTASREHRTLDAQNRLLGDLLSSDDDTLLKNVHWCPALKRPVAVLQWSFGAELRKFPVRGPANLIPENRPGAARRSQNAENELSQELAMYTGTLGEMLGKVGLMSRVSNGDFGDWYREVELAPQEHRGTALLDFATLDGLLKSSEHQHADVLMAFVVTYKQPTGRNPNLARQVQLLDVVTGEKLFESDLLHDSKVRTGRNNNKQYDAMLAGEVLTYIDEKIKLRPMPKLTPAIIEERMAAISQKGAERPLQALIELRYYQLKHLIEDAKARDEISRIAGSDIMENLVSEDEELRYKAVDQLLPANN